MSVWRMSNFESFFEPLTMEGEDYFSTPKQFRPDFEGIIKTQALFVETEKLSLNELTMLHPKGDVLLLTNVSKII